VSPLCDRQFAEVIMSVATINQKHQWLLMSILTVLIDCRNKSCNCETQTRLYKIREILCLFLLLLS